LRKSQRQCPVVSSYTQRRPIYKHDVLQLLWTMTGEKEGHDGPTN